MPVSVTGLVAYGLWRLFDKESPQQRKARAYREQVARAEAENGKRGGQPPPLRPRYIAKIRLQADIARQKAQQRFIKEAEALLRELNRPHAERVRSFYNSKAWDKARSEAWSRLEHACAVCGTRRDTGATLVVDHILPAGSHWQLRLDPGNFQILCRFHDNQKGSRTNWKADVYAEQQIENAAEL